MGNSPDHFLGGIISLRSGRDCEQFSNNGKKSLERPPVTL